MRALEMTGRDGSPDVSPSLPSRRPEPGLRALPGLFVLVLAVLGFGVVASRPAAPSPAGPLTAEVAAAGDTIEALLDPASGRDPIAALPADFSQFTGIVPERTRAPDGTTRAIHVDGGCSTPWGDDNTVWDYGVGCKAHDLGYDLLRYAQGKGQPLPADLRERLDDKLSSDMHAQCDLNPRDSAGTCRLVASLYTAGLVVNSWHQRWGPPVSEPLGPWAIGLLAVVVLLTVRLFGRYGPRLAADPIEGRAKPAGQGQLGQGESGAPSADAALPPPRNDRARASFMSTLRVASLAAIVVGESLSALLRQGDGGTNAWPVTWLLQGAPVLFFAGGHANVLAWREVRAAGGDYGRYLVNRIGTLIRPMLAFVLALLVVPLSLELLDAPDGAIPAVGQLVVQPLWVLGIFLLVVAACPAMIRLHERHPVRTLLTLGLAALGCAVMTTVSDVADGSRYLAALPLALLFAQAALAWEDGRLGRVPRPVLVGVAAVAVVGICLLVFVGGQSPTLMPSAGQVLAPSLACLLLVGVAQICLVSVTRLPDHAAGERSWRLVRFARDAPMTAYLISLGVTVVLIGLGGAVDPQWIESPRTWFGYGLLAVSVALAFRWFERPADARPATLGDQHGTRGVHATAVGLGVGYGLLSVLGFAVTGPTWRVGMTELLGLHVDPLANLIHLLLGWYVVHLVRVGASDRPFPWLIIAAACVPPMITTPSTPGYVLHGGTIVVALVVWALGMRTRRVPAAVVSRA